MNLDISDFPLVHMGHDPASSMPMEGVLRQFSDLLARDELFLFMSAGALGASGDDDVRDRKKVSLWMKANKGEIRRLVKAHIHVQPDAETRLGDAGFAEIFEKFWGYPMFIVASPEEAREKAAALLVS